MRGFQILLLATGSVPILPVQVKYGNDKSTATKNENRCSNSVFQCLTKMKVRIPFFNEGGKRKTKMKVRIPFFNEGGKRKTKMEVRIPFSHVAGKRLALRYTHSMAPVCTLKILLSWVSKLLIVLYC